jgi:16S rRNA (uracil1498-N3)-methyltransferase
LSVGSPIRLFDGRGGEYRAVIESIDRHGASAHIEGFDPIDREWETAPTLVQAVIATDPMDIAVRKAVELGVATIQPVIAARSQGAPGGARGEKRVKHWRSIAIAACEQCGRNRVPHVAEPVAFDAWLRGAGSAANPGAIAGPGATVSLASFAARSMPRAIVVGPEGGFTEGEMALAVAMGLVPVHLGPRVLRADTAATAALATLAALGGDAR